MAAIPSGNVTLNFSLDEFLVSDTAVRHGIANTPTAEHLRRLKSVTIPGMQLVRNLVGRAIVVTSAYRNPQVNRLVGGTATSAHPQGWAVDSRAAGLSTIAYARLVADAMKPGGLLHGRIDQLILESSRRIIHISFDPRARGQIKTQKGGPGTPIIEGLHA